jgi:flagellar hook-associated protein 1 FlgK
MSLSAILNSANSGLMAAQTGLRTVSDNIANINTPGYVRKIVNQAPMVSAGMGVGVDITSIQRAADPFLQRASLTARGDRAEASVISDFMDRAQSLFGDPSASSSFFSRLDDIYSAFTAAGSEAASNTRRQQSIDSVTDFLNESQRIAASLKSMEAEADTQIAASIDKVNGLLKQIESLNGDISRALIQGVDATGSENIQSQLIDELSGLMDVTVQPRNNGGFVIRASDGNALAGAGGAAELNYVRTPGASGEITVSLPGASGEPSLRARITSGEIRGLLDLRDKELPALGDQLSEFVTRAVDELNRAHNAASAVPAPNRLSGRDTGMDLSTAIGGFSGKTTVAIVDQAGMVTRQVDIDFDAGTMSSDGGVTNTPFTPATFQATMNAALGGQGTVSFVNGAMTIQATTSTSGVAITDDATTPSDRAGKGFSHFFGLNDLVTSSGYPFYETGLTATDPHGFTPGDTLTLRVAGKDGARIRDVTVTIPPPPATTMQDLVDSLNANTTGVGLYGSFSLDADGALAFSGANGSTVSVVNDNTKRGVGGPSVSQMFGIGEAQRASRVGTFEIRSDIAADPKKLALAQLDLAQVAAGRPALAIGDGRGAAKLAAAGDTMTGFDAVGGASAGNMTVAQYAAEFAGTIGRKADAAISRAEIAQAVAAEADSRRSSAEGVNLDQELISMTTYQQAFSASARLVQASKDLYDVLLTMVG